MPDDCIINDRHGARSRVGGMRTDANARDRRIGDDVVSNDRIRYHLYSFAAIPDNIAFDQIGYRAAALYKDAGILHSYVCVVNHIVANSIPIRAGFDFNAVIAAVTGGAQVMDIIAFEQAVSDTAAGVVTAFIHALALGGAIPMNMVAAKNEGVRVAAVGRDGVILTLGDLAVFDRDVMTCCNANADAAAAKMQTSNNQVRRIGDLEVILFGVGLGGRVMTGRALAAARMILGFPGRPLS
jgi:hypothetical protein